MSISGKYYYKCQRRQDDWFGISPAFVLHVEWGRSVSGESSDILISMKACVVAINAPCRIIFAHEKEQRIIVNQRQWRLQLNY